MNDTVRKFGYPDTCVHEYDEWVVLLRLRQVTLGSLVLAYKGDARAWPEVSEKGFAELKWATAELEATLKKLFSCDKINYLMLMMVDPHVHFHVIPRYASEREFEGLRFTDRGWPKHPDMGAVHDVPDEVFRRLAKHIQQNWVVVQQTATGGGT